MASKANRRKFLQAAGLGVAATAALQTTGPAVSAESTSATKRVKIIAVSGSPRKGKTTAAARPRQSIPSGSRRNSSSWPT